MVWTLLVSIEVVHRLDSLAKAKRLNLLRHFEEIATFPENFTESVTTDDVGRRIEVSTHGEWLIFYWTDFSDPHVKILKLLKASEIV